MKKIIFLTCSILLVSVLLLCGCSSQNSATSEGSYTQAEVAEEPAAYDADGVADKSYDDMEEEVATSEDTGGANLDIDNAASILEPSVDRKIIYNAYIETQTKTYDDDYHKIINNLDEVGGYVESANEYGTTPEDWQDSGRRAEMVLRVPSAKFDAYIAMLKGLGRTITSSVSGEDISLQYYDVETKLEILRNRETRLLELLEEAKGLEDIIELERELADVSYEIQILQTNLRNYDSLIDFSKVTITLYEVNEITAVVTSDDATLGERISSGFYSVLSVLADFGEGLVVFFLAGSPVLLILAVIAVVIIVLVKRSNKKNQKNNTYGGGSDNEK